MKKTLIGLLLVGAVFAGPPFIPYGARMQVSGGTINPDTVNARAGRFDHLYADTATVDSLFARVVVAENIIATDTISGVRDTVLEMGRTGAIDTLFIDGVPDEVPHPAVPDAPNAPFYIEGWFQYQPKDLSMYIGRSAGGYPYGGIAGVGAGNTALGDSCLTVVSGGDVTCLGVNNFRGADSTRQATAIGADNGANGDHFVNVVFSGDAVANQARWVENSVLSGIRNAFDADSISGVSAYGNLTLEHINSFKATAFGESACQEVTDEGLRITCIGPDAFGLGISGVRSGFFGTQAGYMMRKADTSLFFGHRSGANNDTVAAGFINLQNQIICTGATGVDSTLSTGNCGIGTWTPGVKFDVVGGSIRASSNVTALGTLFGDSLNVTGGAVFAGPVTAGAFGITSANYTATDGAITITSASATSEMLDMTYRRNDVTGPSIDFNKSRAASANVVQGDATGELLFRAASGGSSFLGAAIKAIVNAPVVNGQRPGQKVTIFANAANTAQDSVAHFAIDGFTSLKIANLHAGATVTGAAVTLAAATTSYPSIIFTAGTDPTAPPAGAVWFDGTDWRGYNGTAKGTFEFVPD